MLYPRLSAHLAPDVELDVYLLAVAHAAAGSPHHYPKDVIQRAYAEIRLDGRLFHREFPVCSTCGLTEPVKAEAYRKAVQYLQASGDLRLFLPLRSLEWRLKG